VRVLHVCCAFPPSWAYGGIPRAVGGLVRAQAALGVQVRVWTTDALDQDRRVEGALSTRWEGVELERTRLLSQRLAWEQQLYLPSSLPPLEGVELLHLHGHRTLLNTLAWREAKKRKIPVVFTPHGTAPRIERKVGPKWIWDRLFDGDVPMAADRVIALSKAELRELLRLGVPADRLLRIPNGFCWEDPPPYGRFRARHGLGDQKIVAYLGQVSPRKGVDVLVAAFAEGKMGPTRLVIAGPERGMQLATGPEVLRPGVLEGEERLELLVDADVLAYASTQEVFGLVPLEGLWCGTPVVVAEDCGCGELIAEAQAGLLVPHGDVEALRRALTTLLTGQEQAQKMVEKGQAYIREHLDAAEVARRHIRLYSELLGR
jgi:glycosyltransferase involved in cell wall biosynthesis